jgi:hypothetical protein
VEVGIKEDVEVKLGEVIGCVELEEKGVLWRTCED